MARPIAELRVDVATIMVAAGNTTPHFEGEEYLRENGTPPRYVWVPTTDEPAKEYPGGANPRAIYAFDEHVEVHCWGDSRDSAYELRNAVLRALRTSTKAAASVHKSGWLRPNRDTWTELGHVYVLHVVLDAVPVPATAAGEVTISGVQHTGEMVFPSGPQVGCQSP